MEASDHHASTGAGDPVELGDHLGGVGGELAHRHRERGVEAVVVEREPVDIALDQFTCHAGAGDGERRRVGVDTDHVCAFGFEPGGEAAGAAAGVAHVEPGDGTDGVEQQVVLDAACVAAPWLVEPGVVGGGVCTPAGRFVGGSLVGHRVRT